MVRFQKGALLSCDAPIRQYILHLNSQKPGEERFVIDELDDTHVFVQASAVPFVQEAVKEWHEKHAYRDPSGLPGDE